MAKPSYTRPYDPTFLGGGFDVPLPTVVKPCRALNDGEVFDYIHFSLVMHERRRTALFVAHNIDGANLAVVKSGSWKLDERIGGANQLGDEVYKYTDYHRGHLARRAALAWGGLPLAEHASKGSFYFSNAALQHENFNGDEWRCLEDWALADTGATTHRVCVFSGPVFADNDAVVNGGQVPAAFWKVIVLRDPTDDDNDLCAVAFLMKQSEMWEDRKGAKALNLQVYQVSLADVARMTGLDFGPVAQVDDYTWGRQRFRDRDDFDWQPIHGPGDIGFFGAQRRRAGFRAVRRGDGGGPDDGGTPTGGDAPGGGAAGGGAPGGGGPGAGGGGATGRATRYHSECRARGEVDVTAALTALNRRVEELADRVADVLAEPLPTDPAALRAVRNDFGRIVGGMASRRQDFPHCVCIGEQVGRVTEWFCSGVLIAPRVVLTAAHCTAEGLDRVFVGGISIEELSHGAVIGARAIPHPEYDERLMPAHDLAVVLLDEPVERSIAPVVKLATADELSRMQTLWLAGYGYNDAVMGVGFGRRRQTSVGVLPPEVLSADQRRASEVEHGYGASHEFKAGSKNLGRDSCRGDSGGPAYLARGPHEYVLAGITSRVAASAEALCGDGGIYTRVLPYLDWIEDVSDGLFRAERAAGGGGVGGEVSSGGATAVAAQPRTAVRIRIVGAVPNPEGPDRGNETVTLRNLGGAEVSLDGWSLQDRSGRRCPLDGVIGADAERTITLPGGGGAAMKLVNTGGTIELLDGEAVHARVSYARAAGGEHKTFDTLGQAVGGGEGGEGGSVWSHWDCEGGD